MRKSELEIGEVYTNSCKTTLTFYSKNLELKRNQWNRDLYDPVPYNQNQYVNIPVPPNSTAMEFLGYNTYGQSVFKVIENLLCDEVKGLEKGSFLFLSEHGKIQPYDGDKVINGMTSRQRITKKLQTVLNKKQKELKSLKTKEKSLSKEISELDLKIERLGKYESDEAEKADLIFKLINEKGTQCISPKEIEDALKITSAA